MAFLGSIVIKLSSISTEDPRPKCRSGTRKETLNAVLSGHNSGRDDAENEHLLRSRSNVEVGLGRGQEEGMRALGRQK